MRTAPDQLIRQLELVYAEYHRPRYLPGDPLAWVWQFRNPLDREVVALVASAVAFGNVVHIQKSIGRALSPMGTQPASWLKAADEAEFERNWRNWRHRWATGRELVELLLAVRRAHQLYGSLGALWAAVRRKDDADAHETLLRWTTAVRRLGISANNALFAEPARGSPCKRLHLFLRWMIRRDHIDPGGWPDEPRRLLVPLDTHMFRIGRALNWTRRATPSLAAARDITAALRRIDPDDPVRFDFALTRLPIEAGLSAFAIRRLLTTPGAFHR